MRSSATSSWTSLVPSARAIPRFATTAAPLVFRGVTVIGVERGRRLPAQTVTIIGNRVYAIGPTGRVAVPRGSRVVDARGKYLIPGLWDMHVHPIDYAEIFYPLFVAYGITGVRDAGSSTPLATFNRWKQEIAAGTRVGPRLFVAGPSINECPGSRAPWQICVSTSDEARLAVDFLKLAGADFIKPYDLSRELYLAMLAEARRIGIPFGGHAGNIPGLEASDSGARFLDHYTWFNPNVCGESAFQPPVFDRVQCDTAGERLRRNGTWVVDTPLNFGATLFPELYLEFVHRFYADSGVSAVSASMSAFLRDTATAARDSVLLRPTSITDWKAALQRPSNFGPQLLHTFAQWSGIPVLAGTDGAPILHGIPGYGLHEVLVAFVLNGMTPLQALQTATLNPAKALGATDSLGTVAAGKLADLVLLDADPLDDIWNTSKIRGVVANGRYFDRVALDRLQAQAEQAAHGPRSGR